jgi:protein-S-isoprenylcysteine O-methyltransferase Ste14
MSLATAWPAEVACFFVALGWLGFGVILLIGHRGASKSETRRDPKSAVGFLLQCVAYAMCFVFARTYFSPFFRMSTTGETILALITVLLAVVSIWFCHAAARALGRQWALAARVIEGHELIARGPFAVVRNPIYLAMFGMLLATGFAVSRPWALLVAGVVFLMGTAIRIRTEEHLLRQAFGATFDDYARRVPALIPRIPL